MNAVIFLGPTLSREDASKELDASYLPPVAQGDVFRATKEHPFAIGIIDGYFDRQPAVWHKEILWALAQGIHVFGAASMGALRAAELDVFGMKGIGSIYSAFRSGEIEDDDEVAVAHGDESTGYRTTSEAMVNVRATLHSAERSGVLTAGSRVRIEALAKQLFYPDRSYPHLLETAMADGIDRNELQALRTFLCLNRVDQKRADARALLRAVTQCCAAGVAPTSSKFSFAHTAAWDDVVSWAEGQPPMGYGAERVPTSVLAAEVRLLGPEGRAHLARGLIRAAAGAIARKSPVPAANERLERCDRRFRAAAALCAEKPLDDGSGFDRWLAERGLTLKSYDTLLQRQIELDWLIERFHHEVDRHVVDELRVSGNYERMARRAKDKHCVLARHGLDEPTLEDSGLSASELLLWYFNERLGRSVPSDLEAALAEIGIGDVATLQREALREILYERLSSPGPKD